MVEKKKKFLPQWLKKPLSLNASFFQTNDLLAKSNINTVCLEAKCPNRLHCFERKRATFLALGKFCTRKCVFCDIKFSKSPPPPDEKEPRRIARAAKEMHLHHIVITMVSRDDLKDFGSGHLCKIVSECKKENKESTIELLTSDFQGDTSCLDRLLLEKPNVFNHNIETVQSLTPKIRNRADYLQSLKVIQYVKNKDPAILTKSGLMVGLGETSDEVESTLLDLKAAKCDIVTVGQYLQPSKNCIEVKEYIHPEIFKKYEKIAKSLNFRGINIGPLVRSSFNADLLF